MNRTQWVISAVRSEGWGTYSGRGVVSAVLALLLLFKDDRQ
jgi:hypothetical protein